MKCKEQLHAKKMEMMGERGMDRMANGRRPGGDRMAMMDPCMKDSSSTDEN